MKKKKVVILCGGRSVEHEISLLSAKNVFDAIDTKLYEVSVIGITKTGKWIPIENRDLLALPANAEQISIAHIQPSHVEVSSPPNVPLAITTLEQADVVFPILHGTYGEDGTVQGLCKLLNVACVGSGVLGSAVAMDKDVAKRLLREAGIPVARGQVIRRHESYDADSIVEKLGLPLFVKPANCGSSVGVVKVITADALPDAIERAFKFDTKILIEEAIIGRELECAVLGNDEVEVSGVGEVVLHDEFYSYEAKYVSAAGATVQIPADISPEATEKIRTIARQVYQTLECSGMARVDVFLTDSGEVIVNEVNTIPGFTNISMYPKLWEASGVSYQALITKLIQLAEERA